MKFTEYLNESDGLTNSEDRGWVTDALKFWKEQEKKHPRSKHIKDQIKQFEKWFDELK